MTILAENYLHYYFDDADNIQPINNITYNQIINQQIQYFRSRKKIMQQQSGLNQEDFVSLVEILTSDSQGIKKQIFEQEMGQFANDTGIENLTYSQFGNMNIDELSNLLEKQTQGLADSINTFTTKLEEYLEIAYKKITNTATWEEYKQDLVIQYCKAKHVSPDNGNLNNMIIQDFLQHEGLKKLKITNSSGSYETAIQNLTLLASALPDIQNFTDGRSIINYSTGYDGAKQIRGTGEGLTLRLLQVIARKVSGGFSNVKGFGAEMAWANAEIQGQNKLMKEIQAVNKEIQKKDISVKSGDSYIQRDVGKRVSKGDVTVTVTNDNVFISYGISVKNYGKPSLGLNIPHITLGTYSNFLDLANKAGYNDYSLVHYAAAHQYRNKTGTSNSQLYQYWETIKQQTATMNIVDILAGQGQDSSDNVLVLVINGNAFTIDEILSKLVNENDTKKQLGISNTGLGGKNRLISLNTWKRDSNKNGSMDEAENRGKQSYKAVIEKLSRSRFRISLNNIIALAQ